MKDEATPEQLAMARRICTSLCDIPAIARNYEDGTRDGTREMEAAIMAIRETTRLSSVMAADTLDKARAGVIDNDLRCIKHILVGRFVDDDHLKGQDHG